MKLALIIVIVLLNIGDVLLTQQGMQQFGPAGEGNPLARYLVEHFGNGALWGLKAVLVIPYVLMYKHISNYVHIAIIVLMCFVLGAWVHLLY